MVDRRWDRCVHAFNVDYEIVRYDKAGKWYIEPRNKTLPRQHVNVSQAAQHARWLRENSGGTIRLGLSGGGAFDRAVKGTL